MFLFFIYLFYGNHCSNINSQILTYCNAVFFPLFSIICTVSFVLILWEGR